MSNVVKCQKIEILKPLGVSWQVFGKLLRDIDDAARTVSNLALNMAYDFNVQSLSYKARFGEYLRFEDLGAGKKSQESDAYAIATSEYPSISTKILDGCIRSASKLFKSKLSDIISGKCTLPVYKSGLPIPISKQSLRLYTISDGSRCVNISLMSRKYDGPTSYDVVLRCRSGSPAAVFDRILSGEYDLGDSKLQRVKSKWYLLLTYKHRAAAAPDQSTWTNVMGVDMGVVNAAVIATHEGRWWEFYSGSEITAHRARVSARRAQLQKQAAVCGPGRVGHGYKTRLRPALRIEDKIARFKNTVNHTYARRIVDAAIKERCCRIQVEDLTGISTRSRFLRNWPYYDLQTKIESKARAAGIEFVKVDASYTSKRCSRCGNISDQNRDISKSQSAFKCVSCDYEIHADLNAARNIAHPHIEEIIAEELKRKSGERATKNDAESTKTHHKEVTKVA